MEPTPAQQFDAWYSDMDQSPTRDEIVRRTLGLPPELESSSLLSWEGIAEVTAALALQPGEVLLDLACGRGGYGREIARRTGSNLVGVDFSAVAIERARRRAEELGLDAGYEVGELESNGLEPASVDAIVCIDAIQFAGSVVAALEECRRVLRPRGRVVLTCWEGRDRSDERVPERLRSLDLDSALRAAGFAGVVVEEKAEWEAAERAMWEEAIATDPGDDPGLASLKGEAEHVLPGFGAVRRVLARAVTSA